ncbi:phage head closure protein (plasmid) [Desemzia incerta]|uniref:phage head closure protein n=1 Tax=Desemzia incerta TaxID=82801 RepID=UPI0024C2257C|nr:phage head closure protein [Desemzia incerta]WHZ33213.1 phage head closure protein [Desemzia incerta]
MNPGKLNRKIEVLAADQVSDGAGGFLDVFITIKNLWGSIKSVNGKERIEARQAQAEISHKVTIRYDSKINHSHLLAFNGYKYDIQYIVNINDENRFMELAVLRRE